VVYIRLILISIIVLIASISSIASGYVVTHNIYYTDGGAVDESMTLNNMTYANEVSIYRDSLFADADAVLANDSMLGSFSDHILTTGKGNGFGIAIKANSDNQFDYHRSLAAGACTTDTTTLTYTLQSGQTAANYFTDGGSVFEDIAVDNVKYEHSAGVQPYLLFGSGNGDLVEEGIGQLKDNIFVNRGPHGFGTDFMGAAKDELTYEKSFQAGQLADNRVDVSYTIETGIANANYFNPSTLINEGISTDACMYSGMIKNTADSLDSSGQGHVTMDSPSGFIHKIQMNYGGKFSTIEANLTTGEGTYGSRTDVPVMYTWNTLVDSDGNSSKDTIDIIASNGNRNINMSIVGKSQGLTDKCAGPLYLSPFGFIGVSKELYMSYEINK